MIPPVSETQLVVIILLVAASAGCVAYLFGYLQGIAEGLARADRQLRRALNLQPRR